MEGRWIVTKIYSSWSKLAESELDRLEIEHFIPRMLEKRLVKHRIVNRAVPLFPGYMFVCSVPWRFLHQVRGVCFVLRNMETEEPLRSRHLDSYIEDLRRMVASDGMVPKRKSRFLRGARVRSMSGLLEGYCGKYLHDVGMDRCRVEMDGLGKVDFEIFDLEPAA